MNQNKIEAAVAVAGSTAGTKTITAMEQETLQLAYTVGGATIGIADVEVTTADYTAGKDRNTNSYFISNFFLIKEI